MIKELENIMNKGYNDWESISSYENLSEELMDSIKDKINWDTVSMLQPMCLEFIKNHLDYINLNYLIDFNVFIKPEDKKEIIKLQNEKEFNRIVNVHLCRKKFGFVENQNKSEDRDYYFGHFLNKKIINISIKKVGIIKSNIKIGGENNKFGANQLYFEVYIPYEDKYTKWWLTFDKYLNINDDENVIDINKNIIIEGSYTNEIKNLVCLNFIKNNS